MKRTGILILLALFMLSCLTGCGAALEETPAFTGEQDIDSLNEVDSSAEKFSSEEKSEALPSIPISYEALKVDYTGKAPIYDVCNYRDKIYFTCERAN